jgi:hypothetical protein
LAEEAVPDTTFYLIAALSGFTNYLVDHQASHIVAISSGQATLNPLLARALRFSHGFSFRWLGFTPLLFMVWYGYKTTWWNAVGAFVLAFLFHLVITNVPIPSQQVAGLPA